MPERERYDAEGEWFPLGECRVSSEGSKGERWMNGGWATKA